MGASPRCRADRTDPWVSPTAIQVRPRRDQSGAQHPPRHRATARSHGDGAAGILKGFRPKAQGCEARATLGQHPQNISNRNAVAALPVLSTTRGIGHNPVGVVSHLNSFTQGSSSPFRLGSTLGWRTQSRWDCRIQAAPQLFVGAFNPKTGKLNREIHQTREKGKSIPSVWFRSRILRGSRLKICLP